MFCGEIQLRNKPRLITLTGPYLGRMPISSFSSVTLPPLLTGWLGSRVVSVLDSGAEGPGFNSHSRRCRVAVLGKLFTPGCWLQVVVGGDRVGVGARRSSVGRRPGLLPAQLHPRQASLLLHLAHHLRHPELAAQGRSVGLAPVII